MPDKYFKQWQLRSVTSNHVTRKTLGLRAINVQICAEHQQNCLLQLCIKDIEWKNTIMNSHGIDAIIIVSYRYEE